MRLALFQPDHRLRQPDEALNDLDSRLVEAAAASATLLVTPELFLCGYGDAGHTRASAVPGDGPLLDAVAGMAARHGVGVVFTYPEQQTETCFNSATVIDGHGKVIGTYRKPNLANEYERGCFAPGGEPLIFDHNGVRCGLLVCYDVEFPEMVRHLALRDVELVIVPTALTEKWRFAATHLVPTRAYENGIFVAYCNFAGRVDSRDLCGLSVVAGPDGRDVARADKLESLLIADVDTDRIADIRAQLHFLRDLRFKA